jgi:hypothetical protein
LIPFFLATQFVLHYLGWKFEKVGQKNEVIGWRNPKMQEWEDQETCIGVGGVGWEVHNSNGMWSQWLAVVVRVKIWCLHCMN